MSKLLDIIGQPVERFKDGVTEYTLCSQSKKALNKVLGTSFKAVYRERKYSKELNSWKNTTELCCDGEVIYVMRPDNNIVVMSNSEWSTIWLEKYPDNFTV